MKRQRTKRAGVRLDPDSYRRLAQEVLKRDAWCCQFCGGRTNLHVHHVEWRSHLGRDQIENLITLCASCHSKLHAHKIR